MKRIAMARQLEFQQPFDLNLCLTMGQAFRWVRLEDGWFSGVLGENLFHIRQIDSVIEYRVSGPHGEREPTRADDRLLSRYFRDNDDVGAIYAGISRDPIVANLVRQYPGMRVLRQDSWECLVAYMCSANNNIAQIARVVEKITDAFGPEVELGGETRRAFPSPERLVSNPDAAETLDDMRLGLQRAPNIMTAAGRICEGKLNLDALSGLGYSMVKAELRQCPGVGNKIADCIALFSLDKLDAFPVDLHIGRSLVEHYDCPLSGSGGRLTESIYKRTVEWAQGHFGPYCGWAGQYLFHGMEPNK